MSAPLRPAAWTRTRSCPSWGSGSGCSTTSIRPSRMVAARMFARLLPVRRVRRDPESGKPVAVGVSLPHFPRSGARASPAWRPRRCSAARCGGGGGVPDGEGRPVAADPRLHGGRRLDGHDDPLAARERLPHAPGRDPRQRGLQRGIRHPARAPAGGVGGAHRAARGDHRPERAEASSRGCSARAARTS